MNEFIKQCKGVDANKVKVSDDEMFYVSIKHDGVYVQIHKTDDVVQFFTSSGKEFSCSYAHEFSNISWDFKIETEYIVDGGKLGDRFKADQEIKKAIKDSSFKLTGGFMIFDSLEFNVEFINRDILFPPSSCFQSVSYLCLDYKDIKSLLLQVASHGYEGLFLKKASHLQVAGKKSKDAVKLKQKYTADLVVVAWDGIYLLLEGENGMTAKVSAAGMQEHIEVGMIVEIEYEQIVKTYNQAVFKAIRYDKMS